MPDDLTTRLRTPLPLGWADSAAVSHRDGPAAAQRFKDWMDAERTEAADRIEALEVTRDDLAAHVEDLRQERAARDAVIAEARRINALPAATNEEARQKSDRIEVLLSRVPQGAAELSDSKGYCDECGAYGSVHHRIDGQPCPLGDEVVTTLSSSAKGE